MGGMKAECSQYPVGNIATKRVSAAPSQPSSMSGYSPPFQGGVSARSRKYREATFERADGVVGKFEKNRCAPWFVPNHPVRSLQRWLRGIFLKVAATPPWKGGESGSPKHLSKKLRGTGLLQKKTKRSKSAFCDFVAIPVFSILRWRYERQ